MCLDGPGYDIVLPEVTITAPAALRVQRQDMDSPAHIVIFGLLRAAVHPTLSIASCHSRLEGHRLGTNSAITSGAMSR